MALGNKPVFSDGKVHVMSGQCDTCIFRPGNLMNLDPGRVKSMVDGATANESVIPCHHTLPYHADQREQQAVCHGYWKARNQSVVALRLAQAMDMIEWVDP